MNAFDQFVYLIAAKTETPPIYGWFHLLMFALVIIATVVMIVKYKDCDDKTFRRIMLISWIINVVMEIYVGMMFSFTSDGVTATWSYAWFMFPFQFCSSPIYILPFIAFLRDGKVRDGCIAFTAGFSLFAGAAVMFYPGDVFMFILGINIQTMIHHGMQVILGIFCAVHERKKLSFKHNLYSVPVFSTLVAIALVLNVVVHNILVSFGKSDIFNLFYISPYHPCTLPVMSLVREALPYPVFLLIYIIGFTVIAYIVYYICKWIIDLVCKRCENKAAAK